MQKLWEKKCLREKKTEEQIRLCGLATHFTAEDLEFSWQVTAESQVLPQM